VTNLKRCYGESADNFLLNYVILCPNNKYHEITRYGEINIFMKIEYLMEFPILFFLIFCLITGLFYGSVVPFSVFLSERIANHWAKFCGIWYEDHATGCHVVFIIFKSFLSAIQA
jgi:hypothetical protein